MKTFSFSATAVALLSVLAGSARADGTTFATLNSFNTTNCVDYGYYQEATYAPWEAGSLPGECVPFASGTKSVVWVSKGNNPVVTLYTNKDCTGSTTTLPFRQCTNTNGKYKSFKYPA